MVLSSALQQLWSVNPNLVCVCACTAAAQRGRLSQAAAVGMRLTNTCELLWKLLEIRVSEARRACCFQLLCLLAKPSWEPQAIPGHCLCIWLHILDSNMVICQKASCKKGRWVQAKAPGQEKRHCRPWHNEALLAWGADHCCKSKPCAKNTNLRLPSMPFALHVMSPCSAPETSPLVRVGDVTCSRVHPQLQQ